MEFKNHMNLRRNFSLLGLVVVSAQLLLGCSFADKEKMKKKYGKTKIITEHVDIANDKYVKDFRIEPKKDFNQFEAVLEFNPNKFERLDLDYFYNGDAESRVTDRVAIEDMTYRIPVIGGNSLSVIIRRLNSDNPNPIFSKTLKALPDYKFEGYNRLSNDMSGDYYRLIFDEKALVITEGHNINIKAKEIIAGGQATIRTFHLHSKALSGQDGRDGGRIIITAESAVGSLLVFGDGEDGGDGLDAPDRKPQKAAKGKRGHDAKGACLPPLAVVCNCERNAGSGGKGSPGLNALNGGDAGNGGDTANIFVTVKKESDFKFLVSASPGSRGTPGKKGAPQLGGDGGDRGRTHKACNDPGKMGDSGEMGKSGLDGERGEDGQSFGYCAKVGSLVMGCQNGEILAREKLEEMTSEPSEGPRSSLSNPR